MTAKSFLLLKLWHAVRLNKTFLLDLSFAVILREKTSDKYLTFLLHDQSMQVNAKRMWEFKQPNNLYCFVLKPKSNKKKLSNCSSIFDLSQWVIKIYIMLRWFIAPFFSLIIFILRNCDNKKKELYYRSTSKISLCTYATDSTFLRMIWNRLLSFTKSTFRRFSLYRPLNLTVSLCYHWFYCVKKFWRINQPKPWVRGGQGVVVKLWQKITYLFLGFFSNCQRKSENGAKKEGTD